MPTIRTLAPDDRAGLEAALRSDDTFREDEIIVALELVDAAIEGSDDYWILVAEHAGAVGGYVCYGPTPMTAATYDLYWVVVNAGARGHGLATALVRAMEADLAERGATGVRVETSEQEGYGAARKLYDRLGYPEASRLEDFYSAGDALITYYKRL